MNGTVPAWVSTGCTVAAALIGFGVMIAKLDNVEGDVTELKTSVVTLAERMDVKMADRFTGDHHDRFVTQHHEPMHGEIQGNRERIVALEAKQ